MLRVIQPNASEQRHLSWCQRAEQLFHRDDLVGHLGLSKGVVDIVPRDHFCLQSSLFSGRSKVEVFGR